MLLKLMGDKGTYTMLSRVQSVAFGRVDGNAVADVTFEPSGDTVPVVVRHVIAKSAFVLSDDGHTVDRFDA